MEVEFIRSLRSNDPRVGYHRKPRFQGASVAASPAEGEAK
jgi:hypothetical protein